MSSVVPQIYDWYLKSIAKNKSAICTSLLFTHYLPKKRVRLSLGLCTADRHMKRDSKRDKRVSQKLLRENVKKWGGLQVLLQHTTHLDVSVQAKTLVAAEEIHHSNIGR